MATAPTPVASARDWRDVLSSRQSQRGNIRLNGKAAMVDAVGFAAPLTDAPARSATFIISTPTPDRSDDVMEPTGVLLDNYRKNPVVLYGHGFSGTCFPIGKCEDPDGNLAMVVTDEGIEATCYFADTLEAQQVYELVEQGVLRCASVSFTPMAADVRSEGNGMRPGLHVKEWELLEWSVVDIPDNPEALRKILQTNELAGQAICETILKSLAPLAGKPKGLPMTINKTAKAEGDDKPDDEAAITPDDKPDDSEQPSDEGDDTQEQPPGSKALKSAHKRMGAACKAAEKAAKVMEHAGVKGFFTKHADVLKGEMDAIQDCHKDAYSSDAMDGGEDEDTSEEVAKSLAGDARSIKQIRGLVARIRDVRTFAKGLSKDHAATLQAVEYRFLGLLDEAILKAKPATAEDDLATSVIAVAEQFKAIGQQIKEVMPYRRA